jgi:hypothetical protein
MKANGLITAVWQAGGMVFPILGQLLLKVDRLDSDSANYIEHSGPANIRN